MSESKRTGVWVAQWMEDLGLTPNQTKLYAEIFSLDARGGCFASNEYLGTVLRLKRDTISRLVSELKKKGLLKQTGFDGRKRFLKPVVPAVEPASDLTRMLAVTSRLKEGSSLGVESESGLFVNPKPIHKYELHTKIQKNLKRDNPEVEWNDFLVWSKRQLSFSTSAALCRLRGPDALSGLQLFYWERWKTNPR
ncbi:helix-turn-helix domain-containing protein (plasmid) [Leptospira sp. WS4.C2]